MAHHPKKSEKTHAFDRRSQRATINHLDTCRSMSKPSSSSDGNKENEKPRRTVNDKKIAAALGLLQLERHLDDVKEVLAECVDRVHTLGGDGTFKREKAKVEGHLRHVQNACASIKTSVKDNVKHLNPVPSIAYVHNRTETIKQQSAASDNSRGTKNKLTPASARIQELSVAFSKSSKSSKPPAAKRAKVETRNATTKAVSFPRPKSGPQYTKKEVVELCSPLKGKDRARRIEQLVEEKLVRFIQNGMADSITNIFPDYDMLLATCRMDPRTAEYELTETSFPRLIQEQFDHGHIPDSILEEIGLPKDRDMTGKEVRRDATITQEARQRAKCLTHKHQVSLRKELIANRDAAAKKKEADTANRIQLHLEKNKDCEARLMQLLEDAESGATTKQTRKQAKESQSRRACPPPVVADPPRHTGVPCHQPVQAAPSARPVIAPPRPVCHLPFDRITLEIMAGCCVPQLHSFVYVRECENVAKSCKIPARKGTPEQAKEKENECLIGMAYRVRNKPVVLKLPVPTQTLVPQQQEQRYQRATIIQWGYSSTDIPSDFMQASELLSRPEWIRRVLYCFCSEGRRQEDEISDDMRHRADQLQKILLQRLTFHIRDRVQDPKKHFHWCWKWATSNFGHVAAIMTLSHHVKEDLTCLGTKCLLSNVNNFVPACNEQENLEGCYLYHDSNDGEWIRSGKVTNRSFATRHKEHERAAALTNQADLASIFYCSYPSSTACLATTATRRGTFERLIQFVGVGFDRRQDDVVRYLTTCVNEGDGVFAFDTVAKEKCAKVKFRGVDAVEQKQLHLVAYLCELAYDLALSSNHNVSRSPGFETPLGIFGGQQHAHNEPSSS
jgi:hypothetical protein